MPPPCADIFFALESNIWIGRRQAIEICGFKKGHAMLTDNLNAPWILLVEDDDNHAALMKESPGCSGRVSTGDRRHLADICGGGLHEH